MAYLLIGVVLLILYFAPMLISIALGGWFGWAVGCAVGDQFGSEKDSEDSGGFIGLLLGLGAGVYLVFFA